MTIFAYFQYCIYYFTSGRGLKIVENLLTIYIWMTPKLLTMTTMAAP